MTIPKFRSLACVALGSSLGVLAATFEVPATLKASPITPPTSSAPTGPPSGMAYRSRNPYCCNPAIIKENRPSVASPEAPKAPIVGEEGDLD